MPPISCYLTLLVLLALPAAVGVEEHFAAMAPGGASSPADPE
jgi:hypothetical protein